MYFATVQPQAAVKAARTAVAAKLPPRIKHFAPIGVHLGYRYEDSPLIVPDGTPLPPMEIASHTPCARPGHRAPHAWFADGRSTLDLLTITLRNENQPKR